MVALSEPIVFSPSKVRLRSVLPVVGRDAHALPRLVFFLPFAIHIMSQNASQMGAGHGRDYGCGERMMHVAFGAPVGGSTGGAAIESFDETERALA